MGATDPWPNRLVGQRDAMLHTTLLTALTNTGLTVSTQRAFEVAALTPAVPATGLTALDLALEAGMWAQAGLVAAAPTMGPVLFGEVGPTDLLSTGWGSLQTQLEAASGWRLDSAWGLGFLVGVQQLGVTLAVAQGAWLVESADLWLLVAELAAVSWGVMVVAVGGGLWLRSQVGYDAMVTLCQQRGLSAAEVFSLVTFVVGYVVFDMFVIMAEDDMLEAVSYVFGGIIVAALALLALAVDVQYYFMISAISGGEATLRVFYTDIVNNGLCLLRVFFCWVRYLFYDLQAELVDFAFHYTETAEESVLEGVGAARLWADAALDWAELGALTGGALLVGFDAVAMLVQLLIGGFKLALALFLFWLILDLFLLRTIVRSEALGWPMRSSLGRQGRSRHGWRFRRARRWL